MVYSVAASQLVKLQPIQGAIAMTAYLKTCPSCLSPPLTCAATLDHCGYLAILHRNLFVGYYFRIALASKHNF